MKEVEKVGIFGTLFPKLPSDRELENRRRENGKKVTMMVTRMNGGEYLLTQGRYLTAEDMEEMRQEIIEGPPSKLRKIMGKLGLSR